MNKTNMVQCACCKKLFGRLDDGLWWLCSKCLKKMSETDRFPNGEKRKCAKN